MNETCIFCKIITGDIPSFVVYEDETFKVILDRFPASEGHMLILPKQHFATILEMPEEIATKLYSRAKVLAQLLTDKLGAEGINIVQNNGRVAGQTVDHFHLHLIPRYTGDDVVLNQTTNQDTTLEALQAVLGRLK